ncbi:unnamed protein product [Parajaminaea phylloscopi]
MVEWEWLLASTSRTESIRQCNVHRPTPCVLSASARRAGTVAPRVFSIRYGSPHTPDILSHTADRAECASA